MTVRELIEELERMPMDMPVVSCYKEVTGVEYNDNCYYLESDVMYISGPAVILE